ncbi:MAG: ArnT family glycosyltransferase [Hyphomonadaceae bacterium]
MHLIDRLSASWRGYVLIALVAVCAVLPGFFSVPVLDRDEARFVQASRQMLETGDFVRINVQDEPRNKKPIGIHWAQAAASAAAAPLTHDNNTIWAYRIPSLIGIVLAALATFWGGAVLVGRSAAFIGALLFSATILASTEGVIAKTDALLVGLITLALAALARLRERITPGKSLSLVFWLAIGLGVLVKGPVAPMVAGLTLLALGVWERRVRWMAPLAWWPGPIIAVLIVAPWLFAIQQATNGAFLREAFFGDLAPKLASGDEGHAGPPGYHLALIAATFFPATIGLAPGLALAWAAARAPRKDGSQAGLRFLIAWVAPTWLIFELLPTKLPHYVLPAFPALALLAGAGLMAAEARKWRISPLISLVLFALGAAVLVAIAREGAAYMPGDAFAAGRRAMQTLALGGAGVGIVILAMLFVRAAFARAILAVVVAIASMYLIRERIIPESRTLLISAEAASALRRAGLADRPLTVIGYRETSLAFETRTDTLLLPPDHAAEAFAAAPNGSAMLAPCGLSNPRFAPIGAPVRGLNYANGDEVCLQPGMIR